MPLTLRTASDALLACMESETLIASLRVSYDEQLRRQRACNENSAFLYTTRTMVPQGRLLGAPGSRLDAPPRLTHLETSTLSHAKWWGVQNQYT